MMKFLEIASSGIATIDASMGLLRRLKAVWVELRNMFPLPRKNNTPLDYENDFIEEVLDLHGPRGARAILTKRQRLRFRDVESAIVRDGVWGNGEQFADYTVQGARRVGTKQEGMRTAVLLTIEPRPPDGEPREVRTSRLIRDAFAEQNSFFDLMVERPTGYLSLKILFPKSRPPKAAYLVETPSETTLRRIPVRYTAERRPYLAWRASQPVPLTTYSVRWAW